MNPLFKLSPFKKIAIAITIILTMVALFFAFQFQYYHQTIGRIDTAKHLTTTETIDPNGIHDTLTEQELQLTLLNSHNKGDTINIKNTYSQSQIKDHSYHQGDYVFLHTMTEGNHLTGTIIELKRDHYLILLISALILLLIVVSGPSGLLIFLSFIINGTLLGLLLLGYRFVSSQSLLLLFILAIPIIVTLTLGIANGWHLKTKIAIIATLIGSSLTFLIGFLVIQLFHHQGLHYEEMELVTRPPRILFLSSLLIGCVGAVMDVSMTIISSLFELKETQPNTTLIDLNRAGKKIGEDIMGPMINIMFFSYLSGAIPLVLIFLRNEMSFNYTFSIVLSLEIARALVGSIGIILAVPISIKVTQFFLVRGGHYER